MRSNKSCFISLNENIKSQVIHGDGKIQNVERKGIIVIKTKDNNEKNNIYIYDVFYVLILTQNLLSMRQLVQKGYKIHFYLDKCLIIDYSQNGL